MDAAGGGFIATVPPRMSTVEHTVILMILQIPVKGLVLLKEQRTVSCTAAHSSNTNSSSPTDSSNGSSETSTPVTNNGGSSGTGSGGTGSDGSSNGSGGGVVIPQGMRPGLIALFRLLRTRPPLIRT
jgi:hypothetical protein